MLKDTFNDLLLQNKVSCSFAFNDLNSDNLNLRLNENSASAGFIYRHVGETMNMFGYFFGIPTAVENTTMGKSDEGQGEHLEESQRLVEKGFEMLQSIIIDTPDAAWQDPIETPFFGTVTRARLFAHVLYHNSYHAGQIALTLKKGQSSKVLKANSHNTV